MGWGVVLANVKRRWGLDGEPVLPREWVGALLQALLALGQSLVLADSHDCWKNRNCVVSKKALRADGRSVSCELLLDWI